ncbi:MAG: DUF3846 domain-containing protein [Butyrivibrio sp.]|nr:DUF3846 domain-containing protein [Butyrivibrio sp.]MBR1642151.1 DUF3846 domain-containing protein [Butyrivibrio sp.]
MKALAVLPGQPAFPIEMEKAQLSSIFDFPSFAYPFEDPVALLHDDDGIANDRPPNRTINGELMPGPFYVIGVDDSGVLTDLSPLLAEKYLKVFSVPESFPPGRWKITTETEETPSAAIVRIKSRWIPEV